MAKVALVTGAAQGLGLATARRLAGRSCALVLVDIEAAGLDAVAGALGEGGGAVLPLRLDLAQPDAPAGMVGAAVERFGRLDILVNCAAAAPAEAFTAMTPESWETALLVNVRAVALAMAAAGEAMGRTGGGRIVNVTSAAARMALPNYAAYAATKAAVDSLTRSGAVALAPLGVRVNSIGPGMMDTPLQMRTEAVFCRLEGRDDLERFKAERTARIPAGRRTHPDEMAALVEWLALDAPDYLTAERLNASGGLDKD